MKKAAFVLAMLVVLLSGCSALNPGRVAPVTLTEKERMVASVACDDMQVFNFWANEKYKWATLSLDEYHFDEKVKNVAQVSSVIKSNGSFIFSYGHRFDTETPNSCILFISSDGTQKSAPFVLDSIGDITQWATSDSNTRPASLPKSGTMALACFRYAKDIATFPSQEFYVDPAKHLDEIKDIDITYILTCSFSEDQP